MLKNFKLPEWSKNFYVMFTAVFVIWMMFFDANNMISQIQLRAKLGDLEDEKEYYLEKIKEVEQERKELFSQNRLIEKFAREKYLMKKETEDVYIIREAD